MGSPPTDAQKAQARHKQAKERREERAKYLGMGWGDREGHGAGGIGKDTGLLSPGCKPRGKVDGGRQELRSFAGSQAIPLAAMS